jgi:hypothetical protein
MVITDGTGSLTRYLIAGARTELDPKLPPRALRNDRERRDVPPAQPLRDGGRALTYPTLVTLSPAAVVYIDYTAAREEEIAWAAGLFEGEGCITEVNGRFTTVVNNTDDWVIDRLFDVVGRGRTSGPYRNSEADGRVRKPFWVWRASEEEAFDVLQMLAPWLSPRRLERAYELSGIRFPVKRLPS